MSRTITHSEEPTEEETRSAHGARAGGAHARRQRGTDAWRLRPSILESSLSSLSPWGRPDRTCDATGARRMELARPGHGCRADRGDAVRGVGDPRLHAAFATLQPVWPSHRDADGARASSPSRSARGARRRAVAGLWRARVSADDRARELGYVFPDRARARRTSPCLCDYRGPHQLHDPCAVRVEPFPDPHSLPTQKALFQGDLAQPPLAPLQERALLVRRDLDHW